MLRITKLRYEYVYTVELKEKMCYTYDILHDEIPADNKSNEFTNCHIDVDVSRTTSRHSCAQFGITQRLFVVI